MTYSSAFRSGALYQRAERPSAQQMQVQVIHLLAAVRIAIDDESVAAFRDPALSGQIASHDDHMANEGLVGVLDVIGRRDGLQRDDQQVHGRGGTDVREGDHARIPIHDFRGEFSHDDLLKKCGHFDAFQTQGPQEYQERAALPGGARPAPCCNAILQLLSIGYYPAQAPSERAGIAVSGGFSRPGVRIVMGTILIYT